jgi:predicted ribosome quality control (RQC) complex YloA/Tae2 family protein
MFKRKKRMVDVRELQRRGVVRLPKKDILVPTNREGFVEFGAKAQAETTSSQPQTNTEFFGFAETTTSETQTTNQGRDESQRITDLDNKIYKLEQRIELLEKKLDINQPQTPNLGVMGW